MKNSLTIYTVVPVGVVCVVAGIFIGQQMASGRDLAAEACAESAAVENCCPVEESITNSEATEHAGHEHEAIVADDLDALARTACEHGIAMVECDECRYEAGVVKLEPALAQSLIETQTVDLRPRSTLVRLTGQVQLDRTRSVDVTAAGGGRVEQVLKHLGQNVEKGELLAILHSPELGQAKADFLESEAALELAEATFKREKELLDKQITSQADYLDAANQRKSAQAMLAAAEKRLRLFGLSTQQIDAVHGEQENGDFAKLAIYAPQAGTIIAMNLSTGKIVDTAEILLTISDLSNLWVWCDVYENQLAALHDRLATGEPLEAAVKVNAFKGQVFPGVVDLVENVMDEHTRTLKLRIQLENPEYKLRPGMFADAQILIPQPGTIVAVLSSAVMNDGGRDFVFRQWKDDLWVRADVAVGQRFGGLVEITGGIVEGQTIVTSGAFMLKSDILREKMGAGCAD